MFVCSSTKVSVFKTFKWKFTYFSVFSVESVTLVGVIEGWPHFSSSWGGGERVICVLLHFVQGWPVYLPVMSVLCQEWLAIQATYVASKRVFCILPKNSLTLHFLSLLHFAAAIEEKNRFSCKSFEWTPPASTAPWWSSTMGSYYKEDEAI